MKRLLLQLTALLLLLATSAFAADSSAPAKKAGPNGGRVLSAVQPPLEFFVTPDRKVQISALNADLKQGAFSGQLIAVTAGDRSKPTKMEFKEEGGRLLSTGPIPEGNDYPVSVSIKAGAAAKAVYEKFNLNLSKCPSCKFLEYACTCAH